MTPDQGALDAGFLEAVFGPATRPLRAVRSSGRRESGDLNLATFLELIRFRFEDEVADYPELLQWSIENPSEFWLSVWLYCDIRSFVTWREVLDSPRGMRGARWFSGARLNFAENLLAYRDDTEALVFRNAAGGRSAISYAQLHHDVASLAAALQQQGIQPGDRIAAMLPNGTEVVVAMLAAASVGAIWASLPATTEATTALACLTQIAPKILFVTAGDEQHHAIAARLGSLQRIVVVPESAAAKRGSNAREVAYRTLLAASAAEHFDYLQLPYDFPLRIAFSETGAAPPNCVVHGAGGVLMQHLKELVLHVDMRRTDRVLAVATAGSMMWDYMLSALATGATLILCDAPAPADAAADLVRAVAAEQATMLGADAATLAAVLAEPAADQRCGGLRSLRTLLAFAQSCPGDLHEQARRRLGAGVRVCQLLARADIHACLALGNPMASGAEPESPSCALGMKLEILDALGRPIRGCKGTLACTAPFPSMPIVVWEDFSGEKYRAAYFRHYPAAWSQGDCAEITAGGGLILHPPGLAAVLGCGAGGPLRAPSAMPNRS